MSMRTAMSLALALALGSVAAAAPAQDAPDAARMWDAFLATATAELLAACERGQSLCVRSVVASGRVRV